MPSVGDAHEQAVEVRIAACLLEMAWRALYALSLSLSLSLSHSRTLALSHSRTLALSHSRTPALSHSRTLALSHSRTLALSHLPFSSSTVRTRANCECVSVSVFTAAPIESSRCCQRSPESPDPWCVGIRVLRSSCTPQHIPLAPRC
jgi:hypothetical protein